LFPPRYHTDLWHVGILRAPISACLSAASWPPAEIVWLPAPRDFTFLADPFGLWHHEQLHVFCEAYDYRVKKGYLVQHRYDADLRWQGSATVMTQPFHLSYPFIIAHAGDVYLLPEAHRSGKLTLYRARNAALDAWEPVADLLNLPAIDASVIFYQDRWWMFYAMPNEAQDALHVAWADALTGPWQLHPGNPVHRGRDSSRPGGTPAVIDGQLYLPTQDCRTTYGGALQWLRMDTLTPESFAATPMGRLTPGAWSGAYMDGIHTLSACGPVTLFDVKRIDRSSRRAWINAQRRLRRFLPG
jgi:hypothetical protein